MGGHAAILWDFAGCWGGWPSDDGRGDKGRDPKPTAWSGVRCCHLDRLELHTEAFYLFGWRLIDVLNGSGVYGFDGVAKVNAKGVLLVRNHLLQHPEKPGHGGQFQQSMVVTDRGPSLKTTMVIVNPVSGTRVLEDWVDQGLFVNAEELRAGIESAIPVP
jgi:hypothetical protein